MFQSEHKYFLFTECTISCRMFWATTLSYWDRAILAHLSDRIFICILFYAFIVFWLKCLRNLLTLVQLTMSQYRLKSWLSVKQRHAIPWKKWQPSLLTQNLRHLAWMNKWPHSAWINAVFCFSSAVVTVQGVHTLGGNWRDLKHVLSTDNYWVSVIRQLLTFRWTKRMFEWFHAHFTFQVSVGCNYLCLPLIPALTHEPSFHK